MSDIDNNSDTAPITRFAGINQMTLGAAASNFEDDGKTPRQVRVGRVLAEESMGHRIPVMHFQDKFNAWLNTHSLAEHSGWPYLSNVTTRMAMALIKLSGTRDRAAQLEIDRVVLHERYDELLDHVRPWSNRNGRVRMMAGFSTAPYLHWDNTKIVSFAQYVRTLGLEARAGLVEDQWYNGGTVPITVWNPEMVDLS